MNDLYARWVMYRQWFWLAVMAIVVLVVVLTLLDSGPDDLGGWIVVAVVGVPVFLAVVYGLTRFVVWAARR